MIELEQFKKIKETINNCIFSDVWKNDILALSVINKTYADILQESLDKISSTDITCKELNDIILFFYNTYREKYKSLTNNSFMKACECYSYFAFIELITDHSILTVNVINEIKTIYGENYLEKIKKLDNKFKMKTYKDVLSFECLEAEKKYLLIKLWQEKQNKEFVSNKMLEKVTNIIDSFKPTYIKNSNISGVYNKILDKILKKNIIALEYFVIFYILRKNFDLSEYIGGKAFGLVKLKSVGANISKTFIVLNPKKFKETELINFSKKYAVRSSACCEDGKYKSFAGIFSTYLNVVRKNISEKIKLVDESAKSEKVNAYNTSQNIKMCVIIQEFIEADISGVWFGDKDDKNKAVIEYVQGSGEKLVSGKVIPKSFIYNSASNDKTFNFLTKFMSLQKSLEEIADFEWCVKDNKLYLLQFRPITTDTSILFLDSNYTDNPKKITGISASPGKCLGKPTFIEELDCYKGESIDILLTYYTTPDWVKLILKSKAVITGMGGFLSHTAIICRENNIPCITGIGNENIHKLKNKKCLNVNCNEGTINVEGD